MKVKHTVTPWKVVQHEHVNGELWLTILKGSMDVTHNKMYGSDIGSFRYSALSPEENQANAEFIVRAVNVHDELVEACKSRIDEWHSTFRNMERREPKSLKLARAAIAKAERENS